MTKIIGVHGVGYQFSGENTMRESWLPSLKDGLSRVNCQINDDDFRCAFYGDKFRPSTKATTSPFFDANDVAEGFESDLLKLWWEEASRIDRSVPCSDSTTKIGAPKQIQRALNALSQSKFFTNIAERALVFDLKQVKLYLSDSETRREVRKRVEDTISSDTRVVIAHSLGSIVTYEALCAHPEWQVQVLVTLGSPLGIRNLIFDRLEPTPSHGIGKFPSCVKHWVNIADTGDVVALVKNLSSCFGQRIQDVQISNGAQAHDATRYLTSKELGEAIALEL
ncbi:MULTISPECIES: hypothetical protein [Methylomonas]|uniref:Alpha/beta hydrolase n=1 Tax=Methylomonas koyamae TaxID=702114 RepID=A0A177NWV0_9GAMM|nr:hypothetical protein [Methylomonas koyamae]OAI22124.1 hypothetical protein A1355_22630 [Methylomonas koyamae]